MRKTKWGRLASAFCFIVIGLGNRTTASQSPTAKRCGAGQRRPAQRVFAIVDGTQGWREYRSVGDVPEVALGAVEYAYLWVGRDRNVLIRMEQPTEDFSAYTDYCFDPTGQLIQIKFELRTAWGWGLREEGPILKGLLMACTSEFFSTNTEERISRPEQAADIADWLKPELYLRKSRLPFFKLLPK
jgi:hypothetical protein